MDEIKLHQQAHDLAEMTLANGFDIDAYILKVVSEHELLKYNNPIDLVPESTIDESINELLKSFLDYYKNGDIKSLDKMLHLIQNILSETFHGVANKQEKDLVFKYIQNISKIGS